MYIDIKYRYIFFIFKYIIIELEKILHFIISIQFKVLCSKIEYVLLLLIHIVGAISTFEGKLISSNLNDTTFTAERTGLGKPKLTTFTLTMDDIPTKPIKIGATSTEVRNNNYSNW